jgi:two-component system alkaline phosphatase synthesis response regulator PhoP
MNIEKKILIVEDDADIADLIELHLIDQNWQVEKAQTGQIGLDLALSGDFDLVILDLMLPEIDGLEICRRLRQEKQYIPILVVTSRAEEFDRVLGLEVGADDYITKPFSIRELIARIKAIFRRVSAASDITASENDAEVLNFDQLTVDAPKRKVTLDGRKIELTSKEYELLALFARNPGRAYSRQNLLEQVWGYQYNGYDHTVNSHINRLRAKIEADPSNPRYIKTVWGHGYRFAEVEELEKE